MPCPLRSSYEAGKEWALAVQFCQLHDLPLSTVYPRDCAADAQWLHFLLFIQLHSYPPQQVRLPGTLTLPLGATLYGLPGSPEASSGSFQQSLFEWTVVVYTHLTFYFLCLMGS